MESGAVSRTNGKDGSGSFRGNNMSPLRDASGGEGAEGDPYYYRRRSTVPGTSHSAAGCPRAPTCCPDSASYPGTASAPAAAVARAVVANVIASAFEATAEEGAMPGQASFEAEGVRQFTENDHGSRPTGGSSDTHYAHQNWVPGEAFSMVRSRGRLLEDGARFRPRPESCSGHRSRIRANRWRLVNLPRMALTTEAAFAPT